MNKFIIVLAMFSLALGCSKANQANISTNEPVASNGQAVGNAKVEAKTFVDHSNFKWEAVKDGFDKPLYHGNDGISLVEFAEIMSNLPSRDFPDIYRDCTVTKTDISAKMSVEFIQCAVVNENGELEKTHCDTLDTGYPIGLFVNIHDVENKTIDVHWLGQAYSDCRREYEYYGDRYEYALESAYSEQLGDTMAIHAVVRKSTHNDDCERVLDVDRLDCRIESVTGEYRHYIFAGDDYRLVGAFPERLLNKAVNGCGNTACGESLEADLWEGSLTLMPDKWQFTATHQNMNIVFSSEAGDGEDGEAPKVLPEYEKYLKYSHPDLTFDKKELEPFFETKPFANITGKIDETFIITEYDVWQDNEQ